MKIDVSLLPLKLHYFFIYGGIAPILPYLPVYSYDKLHISYEGIGLIYTLLPFICFIARTTSGTLADYLHAHRTIFLTSIAVCGLSFFSIGFISPLPTKPNPNAAAVNFDCSSLYGVVSHTITKKQCTDIKAIYMNETATCEINCKYRSESTKEFCSYWNISSQCSEEVFSFTTFTALINLNFSDTTDAKVFFPISKLYFNGIEVDNPRCNVIPLNINCSAKCNSDSLMEFLGSPRNIPLSSYSELINNLQFWIYLMLMCLAWAALSVCSVMSDTICFKLLGTEKDKFGVQRLFGSISWGLFVIIAGLLIDMTSNHSDNKNYISAFILSLCILNIDFIVAMKLKVNGDKTKLNRSSVMNLFLDPRIVVFILCCFVVGVTSGVLWTYQLILVEETIHAWNCNFEYRKLLQGLIMAVGSFGGEIPFFFISGYFITKLGYVNSMSLVILVFGLRFILYSIVLNPWLFLPIELLQGFTFGVFCALMTSYASLIAPPGGEATVQGIVSAIQGLGVATGGYVGGALFSSVGGASTFRFVGFFNIGFAFIHAIIQFFLNIAAPRSPGESPSVRYALPSEIPMASTNDRCMEIL